MSLFDRFRRRRGAGPGHRRPGERHPDDPTQHIPSRPGPPAGGAPPARTVVIPQTPAPAVTRAMPPPPPRPQAPAPSPGAPADDPDRTIIEPAAPSRRRVVAVLVGVEGSLEGRVFALFEGENRLGRGEACSVRLPSQRISREHARLSCDGNRFVVEPLSERNPTKVDGRPTAGTQVQDGASLGLGDSTFRFVTVYRK